MHIYIYISKAAPTARHSARLIFFFRKKDGCIALVFCLRFWIISCVCVCWWCSCISLYFLQAQFCWSVLASKSVESPVQIPTLRCHLSIQGDDVFFWFITLGTVGKGAVRRWSVRWSWWWWWSSWFCYDAGDNDDVTVRTMMCAMRMMRTMLTTRIMLNVCIAMMMWMMMNMCVSTFHYEFPFYRVRARSASHVYVWASMSVESPVWTPFRCHIGTQGHDVCSDSILLIDEAWKKLKHNARHGRRKLKIDSAICVSVCLLTCCVSRKALIVWMCGCVVFRISQITCFNFFNVLFSENIWIVNVWMSVNFSFTWKHGNG